MTVMTDFRYLVPVPQKAHLFVAVTLADAAAKAVVAVFPELTVRCLQLSELVPAVPPVVPN